MGYLGSVPDLAWHLLEIAHGGGISVQSNTARESAATLALVASLGWVSTVHPTGRSYGGVWRITREGLTAWEHRGLYPQETAPCITPPPMRGE